MCVCVCALQDKQEVFTSLYTMKWFFQCFLDRVSTSSALIRTYDCIGVKSCDLLWPCRRHSP